MVCLVTSSLVLQAMSMGFPADSCREALKRCHGDIQRAINMLVSHGGVLSPLPPLNQGSSQIN